VTLSCTTVQWRGLTLSSDLSSPFGIRTLLGWDELPDARFESSGRPAGHGSFATPVWGDERVVTLGGQILSADRDVLLSHLSSVMTWGANGGTTEDLVVTRAGRTLTAGARLTAFKTPTDGDWAFGLVPFVVEWRCPDPLRYGSTVNAITTFPVEAGGLEFDLFTDGATHTGALEFGEAGSTGRAYLGPQGGTAPGHTQFLVTGPTPPFSIVRVETGRRIEFSRPVAAGAQLLIDTATGVVLIDGGDVDYSGLLTRWEWEPVEPGAPVTFAFLPHGPSDAGTLTVMHRAAWW